MYVSKLVYMSNGRFMAFGRVFSGTIRAGEFPSRVSSFGLGQQVRILGEHFEVGKPEDCYEKSVQSIAVPLNWKFGL
jgi:elongation factor 2